jgi:glycosyltransferase involved in cell wall biosynthesis
MTSPQHIIICTDAWHDQVNGVVRTLEYLQAELTQMGHKVTIISHKNFRISLPMPGYPEIRLGLSAPFEIRHILNEFDFNDPHTHLHIATEGPIGFAASRYARRYRIPFTTTYHTEFPDYVRKRMPKFLKNSVFRLAQSYVRSFHNAAQTIFVATDSLEQKLKEQNFTPPLTRLTRGADIALFHPRTSPVFDHLKKPIALYVGRVAIEKNLETFLKADFSGTKVIVGDGPSREMLQKQFPNAVFTGAKFGEELADSYNAAQVFAFPSLTDTFGMVIVEALACGLPVAGFPVTGPKDIITSPILGALDNDFSKALNAALHAPGSREDRHSYVRGNYSWRLAAEQFLSATLKTPS